MIPKKNMPTSISRVTVLNCDRLYLIFAKEHDKLRSIVFIIIILVQAL